MQYVRLGRSGLKVSRLALGCMSYGDPGVAAVGARRGGGAAVLSARGRGGHQLLRHGRHVLARRERGSHRPGAARRSRGAKTSSSPRRSTSPMGPGPNMGGLSRKHIVQACEASLRPPGRRRHRPLSDSSIRSATCRSTRRSRRSTTSCASGKVRYIGASSGSAWRMATALSVSERRGWARFISMQNHYNLLYREEEREMIPLCLEHGRRAWCRGARSRAGVLTRPRPADT